MFCFGLSAAASCSDSADKRKVRVEDGGAGGESEATPSQAGAAGAPTVEAMGGVGGVPEMPEAMGGAAGQPAQLGASGDGGSGGAVSEPVTTINADVNLSAASLTDGRTCAEAAAYSVLALNGVSATLATTPQPGCIAPGDELLLINLQGTPGAHGKVGNWELLHAAIVQGTGVAFTSVVQGTYGPGAGNGTGFGTAPGTQRVALIRVPHFDRLAVNEGVTVTADAWNGVLGGVVVLRATELELAGTISAAALGYRGGRWSMDDITCSDSIQSESGESIGGMGATNTLRNLGASGGIGPGNQSFNSDNAVVASPGHAQPGQAGFNPKGRTIGEAGDAYGVADATSLTLGSGPGGGLSCELDPQQATPYLFGGATIQAGGIVLLLVDDLKVTTTGAISASPPDAPRNVAFAGGYVHIIGATLALGDKRVTALGSKGIQPLGPFAGQSNRASPGYIVLSSPDVSGTTDPAATQL